MRIGTHILPRTQATGSGLSADWFGDMVRRADEFGFARISTADSQLDNLECFTSLTFIAMITRRADIGPQVTNPVTRDVGVLANALASLDVFSGGRAYMVMGRGDGAVYNAGLRPATVDHIHQYFVALQELLEEGVTTYEAREVRLPWAPRRGRKLPLYLAAEGPRMLKLAGAIADGVYVGAGLTPEIVRDSLERIHAGAREAGRDPSEVDIWWGTRSAIAPTRDEALARAKESLASAGNHALRGGFAGKHIPPEIEPRLRLYHERFDYSQKGRRTQNAPLMEELALTDYFLQRFGVVGTPEEVVDRLQELRALGIEQINLGAHDPDVLELIGEKIIPAVT